MRWLLVFLLLRTVLGSDSEVGPLLDRESDRAQVMTALMALSRGDASVFGSLPAAVFIASTGMTDSNDPDLIRRWTSAVPVALAQLSAETRASAVEVLDQRCQLLINDTGDQAARSRIAAAFLPAPSAIAHLQRAADRAFDHGDFNGFLSIADVIGNVDQLREKTALALLGATDLSAPGTPVPSAATASNRHRGLHVHWGLAPGWLLALDPWGGVRWQYRLDAKAEVVTGDGGSLVRDGRGLRLIRENGDSSMLPPAPANARMLAVAGGAAWFSTGRDVYRIDLDDRRLTSATLPAEPVSSPLVRGQDSLWLTAGELVLMHGMTVAHRVRHGLPADSHFSIELDGSQPLIVAGDGHAWHVGALEEQLLKASPAERLTLLMRARRFKDAIALLAADPTLTKDPLSRHQALLAHLACGNEHPQSDAIVALATTAQEKATVFAFLDSREALAALCAGHPEVLVPQGDQTWDEEPAAWNHVVTGRAWKDRSGLTTWLAVPPEQRHAIASTAKTCMDGDRPERQSDGSWRIGTRTVRCEANLASTLLECRDRDGLLWRRSWPALDPLAAPGRSLALRDTWIVLAEGAARLRVLDLGNGALLADLDLAGADIAPETVVPLGDNRVADLGPLGLDTIVHLRGATTEDIPLPAPGRWIVPWGDHVVVALNDGRFFAYPGETEVVMPNELGKAPPPFITSTCLQALGKCWSWVKP